MKNEDNIPAKCAMGLATGLCFGALLQKGRLDRRDVIIDQLLLKDHRVIKTMGSAVLVGGLGINYLYGKGYIKKSVKPMNVGGVIAGAVLFGIGMASFGYCPGTSVAAVGEGRKDAFAGGLGMLAGAGLFIALQPQLKKLTEGPGSLGKITLDQVPALWSPEEMGLRHAK